VNVCFGMKNTLGIFQDNSDANFPVREDTNQGVRRRYEPGRRGEDTNQCLGLKIHGCINKVVVRFFSTQIHAFSTTLLVPV
jgi:hypothetical protein